MSSGLTPELRSPHLLLCEGLDETYLATQLLQGLVPQFHIHNCGGNPGMRNAIIGLPLWPGSSDLHHLVILRDAESSAENTLAATRDALAAARLHTRLRVEVIILPEGQLEGALEDVLFADQAPAPVQDCVNQFLACAAAQGVGPDTAGQRAKSRLRAWLALVAPDSNPKFHVRDGRFDLQTPGLQRLRQRILAVLQS